MPCGPNGTIPANEKLFVPEHYLRQFHPDYGDEETFELLDEKLNWPSNPEAPVLNPWMPVQYDPGTRLLLDRNPYYYAVDPAGNQLPYIDSVDVTYVENLEVSKLRVIAGEQEICGRPCRYQPLSELSVFRDAEATVGFKTFLWDVGGGASFLLYSQLGLIRIHRSENSTAAVISGLAFRMPLTGTRFRRLSILELVKRPLVP